HRDGRRPVDRLRSERRLRVHQRADRRPGVRDPAQRGRALPGGRESRVVDVTTTSGMRVIRSAERDHWRNSWLDSWQSFPATGNFDLAGNAFGVLLVHNDDVIAPGEGLDAHQHASVEIVSWVVEGALVHRDSEGNTGTIRPGVAQRMSAGDRVVHSERNA